MSSPQTSLKSILQLKFLSVMTLLSTMSISLPALAGLGGLDAGGGDAQEAEFKRMARSFARFVDQNGGFANLAIPAGGMLGFVQSIQVISEPAPLICEGGKKNACSYPAMKKTEIDADAIARLSVFRRYQLVVHELLVLLSVKDDGYTLSEEFAAMSFTGLRGTQSDSPGGNYHAEDFFPSKSGNNIISRNFDGSISIKNPRFLFEGRLRVITVGYIVDAGPGIILKRVVAKDSAIGVCALFGKSKLIEFRSSPDTPESYASWAKFESGGGIVLTKQGKYGGTNTNETRFDSARLSVSWKKVSRLNSVTCAD